MERTNSHVLQLDEIKEQAIIQSWAERLDSRYVICTVDDVGTLTQVLYHRFQKYGRQAGKGLVILDKDGEKAEKLKQELLQNVELQALGGGFTYWIQDENSFCSMTSIQEHNDLLERE